MRDGSFEQNLWDFKSTNTANKPLCTRAEEADNAAEAAAADGEHYLWFGGYDFYFTQSATLARQTIPRDATHIAMFVSENPPPGSDWRASLFLRIDGTQVLHIDSATQRNFTKVYHNVDVDVRRFADGKEHTLELFFNADETNNFVSIFVDYLRFIRDDTSLSYFFFFSSSLPPLLLCRSHSHAHENSARKLAGHRVAKLHVLRRRVQRGAHAGQHVRPDVQHHRVQL